MNMTVKKDFLPVESGETATILSMISRAAADPNVDMDKMERLLKMRNDEMERMAAAEYANALSEMQPEIPAIAQRGNAAGRYTFAKWEDINEVLKPILHKHGFALNFKTETKGDIVVTGILRYRNGYKEETTVTLPTDPSGGKNAVQAVQSSVSYGKRSTASSLLNITTHGEDDDAYSTGVTFVSEEQAANIDTYIESTGSNKALFLGIFKVDATSKIKASSYDHAIKLLKEKEAKMRGNK